MTQRWRKKLGDLDKTSPGDDVFERAKEGPSIVDRPEPRPKTSTRIITAVAAFAVFALAISVFAIPALRLQGTGAAGGGTGLFPLWPVRTTDQLRDLQSAADAGNASWALDSDAVATRFAQQVLGWENVYTDRIQSDCQVTILEPSTGTIIYPSASASLPGPVPIACADVRWGISTPSSTLPMSVSVGDDGGFVSYSIGRCSVDQQCLSKPFQQVTVYQPLAQGPGQIWAVYSAQHMWAHLSVVAGQTLRSGAGIAGTFEDANPALGFASCGTSGGSSRYEEMIPGDRITLDTQLDPSAACEGEQPGYVWGAVGDPTLVDRGGVTRDPIAEGSACGIDACLEGITAVPVVMSFPDVNVEQTDVAQPSIVETSTSSPAVGENQWQPFTDSIVGWTMHVPDGWASQRIASTPITGFGGSGYEFTGDALTVDVFQGEALVIPGDDSTFPLDYDSLLSPLPDGALAGSFQGNGEHVSIRVTSRDGELTADQEALLRHMVGSISFPHLQPGDRQGMVIAVEDPRAQDQWMQVANEWLILKQTPDGYVALAPVTCQEGGKTLTQWDPSATCPDSTPLAQWSADGTPDPGNATGFQHELDVHRVVHAWDGTLLAVLGITGSAAPSPDAAAPSP